MTTFRVHPVKPVNKKFLFPIIFFNNGPKFFFKLTKVKNAMLPGPILARFVTQTEAKSVSCLFCTKPEFRTPANAAESLSFIGGKRCQPSSPRNFPVFEPASGKFWS